MALIDNWDRMTPAELERAILKGEATANKRKGTLGKETENKAKDAIKGIRGACAWNANAGTPLLDKIVCWKGRFLLLECKETIDPHFYWANIRKNQHTNLLAIEKPHLFGLGLVVIRYKNSLHAPAGFLVSYTEWEAAKVGKRFKYFDLDNPPECFRRFSWSQLSLCRERGWKSEFEEHIDAYFRSRPLPESLYR